MSAAAEDSALPDKWWLDRETLLSVVQHHGSTAETARQTGVAASTLRSAWSSHGLPVLPKSRASVKAPQTARAGVNINHADGTAVLVSEPTTEDLGDIETLLSSRGLNPADWLVERVTVNEWDSVAFTREKDGQRTAIVQPLRQLKVHLRRRPPVELLFPAIEVAERWLPQPARDRVDDQDVLFVIAGDQQAPYSDASLHQAFCRWLRDVKPDEMVLTGDTADFPTISRHPDRPMWNASAQECINSAFGLLSDYRDASPDTVTRKLRGNHDFRLESELLTRAERMFGLKPAQIEGLDEPSGYSIRRLLHLDRLGVELVGEEGEHWKLSEVELRRGAGVWVRHQPPSPGKLTRLHRSVVAGDTHRQSLKQVTVWHDDEPHVITLVETGCLCRVDGLGYTEHPDWQQGFATVALGADGSVGFDLATWRDGVLTWRGERWKA